MNFIGYNYYIPDRMSVLTKYSISFEEAEYTVKVIKI